MSFTRQGSCYKKIRPLKKLMCNSLREFIGEINRLIPPENTWEQQTNAAKRTLFYAVMDRIVSNLHFVFLPVMAKFMVAVQEKLTAVSEGPGGFVRYQYIIDNYRKNGRYLTGDMEEDSDEDDDEDEW